MNLVTTLTNDSPAQNYLEASFFGKSPGSTSGNWTGKKQSLLQVLISKYF
jgi:hypothetical protein